MAFDFEGKLNELADDKDFLEAVCTTKDPEALKNLFLKKEIELDDEAAKAFIEKVQNENTEELIEEELEDVSGGILGLCAAGTIAAYAILGGVGGAVLGGLAVKLYKLIKYKK